METDALEKKETKMMVAIDDSELSYYALMWVLENLQESICKSSHPLILFTVLPRSTGGSSFAASFGYALRRVSSTTSEFVNSVQERSDLVSACILEKAKSICDSRGINSETITVVGNAKEAICDNVQKLKINLLVLGDRQKTVLGSVSNYCVLNAKCPVLVVKKPE